MQPSWKLPKKSTGPGVRPGLETFDNATWCCRPRTKYNGRLSFQFICQSLGGRGYPSPVTGPAGGGGGEYPSQDRGTPSPQTKTGKPTSTAPPPPARTGYAAGSHLWRFPAEGLSCFKLNSLWKSRRSEMIYAASVIQ